MSDIEDWFTNPAANNATPPDGAPESMLRSDVNDTMREIMGSSKKAFDNSGGMREIFRGYDIAIISTPTTFIIRDDTETDASGLLEDGQRIRVTGSGAESALFWEGFVDESVAAISYGGTDTTFGVTWISADSSNPTGPTTAPATMLVGPRELGQAAWYDTGAATGKIPLYDDLDAHVIKTEATLDVGFLDGETREEIQVAAARGRININGGFDFWQRGTSFTSATSLTNDDENLSADNWVIISDGDDRVDIARSTDTPSTVPVQYSIEMTTATVPSNEKYGILTLCELHDALDVGFADSGTTTTVSISFWAKVGGVGGVGNLRAAALNLKTATPSLHPVSAWGSGSTGALTYEPTQWELVNSGTPDGDYNFTIDGTWTEHKIEGLDMDINQAGVGAIALAFHVDESTLTTGSQWRVAAVQINRGDKALPFLRIPAAREFAACQRYCETTFDEGTQPAHNEGTTEALGTISTNEGAGTSRCMVDWRFASAKYKTPSIVTYNPSDAAPATGNWEDEDGDDRAVSTTELSTKNAKIFCTTADAIKINRIAAYVHANVWGAN